MVGEKSISINEVLKDFEREGLYLIFTDGVVLDLSRENVEKAAAEFWQDESKISPELKEAVEFQRCSFCPLNGTDAFCDAIRPTIPFLEHLDKYVSFDKVTAVYKDAEGGVIHVCETTMQQGLKYVSILSLIHYCKAGQKYREYFLGVIPVMQPEEMAMRLYLNVCYLHGMEKKKIDKFLLAFKDRITTTSRNQVERMNLICNNDAFMNAFVNTQIVTEILNMSTKKKLEEAFALKREERN